MPRRRVLADAQLEALLALPTSQDLLVRHYTLSRADLGLVGRRRRGHNRLGYALQLCALRYPGRLLRPGETIPLEILRFVAEQVDLAPELLAGYAARFQTRYEHSSSLQGAFGFRPFEGAARREIQTWLLPMALVTTHGPDLAAALLEELRRRQVIAPGPTVIERLVAGALLAAERHVARELTRGLTPAQTVELEALLDLRPGSHLSDLAWARQPPGAVGHRALARLLEQRALLRSIAVDPRAGDRVHPERLRQLAREGARLTAQHLRALSPLRRRAVLVATVLDTTIRLTDDAIGLFDRLMGRLFRRAEAKDAEAFQADRRAINDKVRLLARLGAALIAAKAGGADAFEAVARVISWDHLASSVEEARRLVRPDKVDIVALTARGLPVVRAVGPALLGAFTFHAVPAAVGLLRAIDAMRGFYASGRRSWPRHVSTGFLRQAWRKSVAAGGGIDRRAFELCLFAELRDRLRAGDVWVEGSRHFRAVEDQLIPRPVFTAMDEAGPLPVAVPRDVHAYLGERRARLERRLDEVEAGAAAQGLEDVRVAGTSLRITPLKAVTPEAAEGLAERLYRMLPRVRITELLAEVDRWTGFGTAFTHLRSHLPADDRRVVLTAALADATNLGLTRMADACRVASYRQLAWTAGWHLREETYARALAIVVDAQHREPLAAAFGTGTVSSSDGQHFHVGGPGEAVGAVNPRHGRDPAVSVYTHVSDRFAPFHARLLPAAAGEAAHVVDGLLHHHADLDIAVHHTDGGGASDHVFALCHLLGFRFAPRIPNLADRRLVTFGPAGRWPTLRPFIAGAIDADLIAAHWEDLLRLAVSVRTGVVSASLILKRLGAYPRQNGLALALRETGRLERTLFTLDWLQSPGLRRQATAELNKGESKNALQRAVCFHRLDRIRDRTLEAQKHRASGLALVVAAITIWNTRYLARALDALRRRGETIPGELLAHLAPLGWQHINLTGDYLWVAEPALDADGYRPLRIGPVGPPPAAA
jgi:TnpA family transposase